jgi:hypothetical protein
MAVGILRAHCTKALCPQKLTLTSPTSGVPPSVQFAHGLRPRSSFACFVVCVPSSAACVVFFRGHRFASDRIWRISRVTRRRILSYAGRNTHSQRELRNIWCPLTKEKMLMLPGTWTVDGSTSLFPRLESAIRATMEEKVRGKAYGGHGGFST